MVLHKGWLQNFNRRLAFARFVTVIPLLCGIWVCASRVIATDKVDNNPKGQGGIDSSKHAATPYTDEQLKELNLGFALYLRAAEVVEDGDHRYARELAEKAASAVIKATGLYSVEHAYCLNLIATLDGSEGEYARVEKAIEEVLRNRGDWPDDEKSKFILGSMTVNLAVAKHQLGKCLEAQGIYESMIADLQKDGDAINLGHVHIALAQLHLDEQPPKLDLALEQINSGAKLLVDLPRDEPRRIGADVALARYKAMTGKPEEALEILVACTRRVAKDISSNRGLERAQLLCRIAEVQDAARDFPAAEATFKEAAELRAAAFGKDHSLARKTYDRARRVRIGREKGTGVIVPASSFSTTSLRIPYGGRRGSRKGQSPLLEKDSRPLFSNLTPLIFFR